MKKILIFLTTILSAVVQAQVPFRLYDLTDSSARNIIPVRANLHLYSPLNLSGSRMVDTSTSQKFLVLGSDKNMAVRTMPNQVIPTTTSQLTNNSGFITSATIHDSLQIYERISAAYDTTIPFNNYLTDIAAHTLTHNDSLVIKVTGAVDNGGAQVLMVNNVLWKPKLGAFHVTDGCAGCTYDNTKTYTLLTFLRKRGIYLVAIKNFN